MGLSFRVGANSRNMENDNSVFETGIFNKMGWRACILWNIIFMWKKEAAIFLSGTRFTLFPKGKLNTYFVRRQFSVQKICAHAKEISINMDHV